MAVAGVVEGDDREEWRGEGDKECKRVCHYFIVSHKHLLTY